MVPQRLSVFMGARSIECCQVNGLFPWCYWNCNHGRYWANQYVSIWSYSYTVIFKPPSSKKNIRSTSISPKLMTSTYMCCVVLCLLCCVACRVESCYVMLSLTLSQCTLAGPVYIGMPLECHWLTQCTLGYHWATQQILARYTGTPLEKFSWNRQDGGTPVSKWTGLCIFSLYLEFTALRWIPVLLLTHGSTSTSLYACLWYEHHYSLCVFGLQVKWNQFSSNNSHHASCIH